MISVPSWPLLSCIHQFKILLTYFQTQLSHQGEMLVHNFSTNHFLCVISCSYYMFMNLNTWRWRAWWWAYRPRGSQVSDRSSSLCLNIWEKPPDIFDVIQQHFNICKHERHWIFWREVRISPAVFVETETGILKQKVSFPDPKQLLFVWVFLPKPSLSISTASLLNKKLMIINDLRN